MVLPSVGGEPIGDTSEMARVMRKLKPGQRVALEVQTDSGRTILDVTLGSRTVTIVGTPGLPSPADRALAERLKAQDAEAARLRESAERVERERRELSRQLEDMKVEKLRLKSAGP